MLIKLIKYDIMFGAKKYAIIAALTAAFLVIAGVAAKLESELVFGIAIFFAIIATIVYAVMYVVISIKHLATQLCSTESYLGYSLPTSTHSFVLSKLISILIWGVVTSLFIVFFWLVGIGGIALATSEISLSEAWSEIINLFRSAGLNDSGVDSIISMIVWMGITSSLMAVSLLGLSVAICNIPFLKERGLGTVTGVVSYFVMSYGINYIIGKLGSLLIDSGEGIYYGFESPLQDIAPMLNQGTIFYSIASLVAAVGIYFLTIYTVERHRFIG